MNPRSVLLIDDSPAFRQLASRLLREYYASALSLVGVSPGSVDALQQARQQKPAIVLLGVGLHSLAGLRLVPLLRKELPNAGIVVLGSLDCRAYRQAAFDAGADAYIAKATLNRTLLATIDRVASALPHRHLAPRDTCLCIEPCVCD